MASRVFGIETEFAVSLARGRAPGTPSEPGEALMQLARRRLPHLPMDGGGGIFLSNGSRLYRDVGGHLELATCEVDSPDDLVRYAAAGDAIVASLAQDFNGTSPGREIVISKHAVDYLQPGVCWAQHESFSHRAPMRSLQEQLIPHLVSRIYCCAGGLNPLCPGIQFTLSPRMHIFCKPVSESTTNDRGIFNTRDEPLAGDGSRRLHVICADPIHSQRGLWLRVATTALVVALAEAGLRPAGSIRLKNPVESLHSFATDPFFRTQAELTDGRRMTLTEIQRQYLQCAVQNQNHPLLPPWTAQVCRCWAEILDLLAQGPAAVEGIFDWSTKYPLFLAHAKRRGIDPDSLPSWNHCLTCLRDNLRSKGLPDRLTSDLILRRPGPLTEHVDFLRGHLAQRSLCWERVGDLLALRDELCEIDVRFGHIAPPGLFAQVQDEMRHRVLETSDTGTTNGDPRSTPPRTTRARLRGAAVRRYSGRLQVVCDWHYVRNGSRRLDLSHPLGIGARWKSKTPEPPRIPHGILAIMGMPLMINEQFDRYFAQGDYDRAYEVLRSFGPPIWNYVCGRAAAPPGGEGETTIAAAVAFRLALVQARRGFSEEAVAALGRRERLRMAARPVIDGSEFHLAVEYAGIFRHRGLVPSGLEFQRSIDAADIAMRGAGTMPLAQTARFIGFKALALALVNRRQEARDLLLPLCMGEPANIDPRIRACNLVELAEIFRAMGQTVEAAAWLDRAEQIQRRLGFYADLADCTHTCRFKCDPASPASAALLRNIKRTQHAVNNRVGLTRTMLLEARYHPSRWLATRRQRMILRLAEEVPDLISCPKLTQILEHWPSWVGGCPDPTNPNHQESDPFWGL